MGFEVADLPYLGAYSDAIRSEVRRQLKSGELGERLHARYPDCTTIINDKLLRKYVLDIKNQFLKRSPPLSKIAFDDRISSLHGALGLHTFVSRVQGAKTKAKNELRVASVFKTLPQQFLRMVVVHELAHLREKDHNRSFFQLCTHMEADYHQLEFDLRLYLTNLDNPFTIGR